VTAPNRKLLIIGLDSAPPERVLDRFLPDTPNIRALVESGLSGPLEAAGGFGALPAWAGAMTGMAADPATPVREPALWDRVSDAGHRVILVGIPQSFPIRPVSGCRLPSFLTEGTDPPLTHPPELRREVTEVAPGYVVDVSDPRAGKTGRDRELTDLRFLLTRHFLASRPWDLAVHLETGRNRIGPGAGDTSLAPGGSPDDVSGRPGTPGDELRRVDSQIGALLEAVGPGTTVLLLSEPCTGWSEGVFVLSGPGIPSGRRQPGLTVLDVAPTALSLLGLPVPTSMRGRLPDGVAAPPADPEPSPEYTEEERKAIEDRLRSLGYL
jgi:predicted AlkP superfamily phosphohydrolase/phosphomutase